MDLELIKNDKYNYEFLILSLIKKSNIHFYA